MRLSYLTSPTRLGSSGFFVHNIFCKGGTSTISYKQNSPNKDTDNEVFTELELLNCLMHYFEKIAVIFLEQIDFFCTFHIKKINTPEWGPEHSAGIGRKNKGRNKVSGVKTSFRLLTSWSRDLLTAQGSVWILRTYTIKYFGSGF